jgi:Tfp pilus assembly protein PilP
MFKNNGYILLASILLLLVFSFSVIAQEDIEENEERIFRNPFVEYVDPAEAAANNAAQGITVNNETGQRTVPIITFEDIKMGIPFRLAGIITSGNDRIAVVNSGDGVEFVRGRYEKNNYIISAISQDSVTVKNRGYTFQLKIGGEINER